MALTVEQADTAAARMKAKLRNGDPFVTGNDWDLDVPTIPAADEAFLRAINNATQIASIYSVPPEMVGGTTGGRSRTTPLSSRRFSCSPTPAARGWCGLRKPSRRS